MNRILNKESGLLGISGVSADNRDVISQAEEGNKMARLAFTEYCYNIAGYIAKFAAAMNGVDVIAFAGGVGERGIDERKEICSYLGFMGVELDEERNAVKAVETQISTDSSKVKVWIVPTEEELMIARETVELIK